MRRMNTHALRPKHVTYARYRSRLALDRFADTINARDCAAAAYWALAWLRAAKAKAALTGL